MTEERVDKWLWTMRLFKTRSVAANACKSGRVLMNGQTLRPSRMVKPGDVVQVKRPPVLLSFQIVALAPNRLSAALVPDYMKHVTPPDQLQILEMLKLDKMAQRMRGTGRPTKKERRTLDTFMDEALTFDSSAFTDE